MERSSLQRSEEEPSPTTIYCKGYQTSDTRALHKYALIVCETQIQVVRNLLQERVWLSICENYNVKTAK